ANDMTMAKILAGMMILVVAETRPEKPHKDDNKGYKFNYSVLDNYSGNDYSHKENSDGHKVDGQYHVLLPDGRKQQVNYIADHNGYFPEVKYEINTPNLSSVHRNSHSHHLGPVHQVSPIQTDTGETVPLLADPIEPVHNKFDHDEPKNKLPLESSTIEAIKIMEDGTNRDSDSKFLLNRVPISTKETDFFIKEKSADGVPSSFTITNELELPNNDQQSAITSLHNSASLSSPPLQISATPQHPVPIHNSIPLQNSAHFQNSAHPQNSAPLQNSAHLQNPVPLQNSAHLQNSSHLQNSVPLQHSTPLQNAIPLQNSAIIQNSIPLQNSAHIHNSAPLQNSARLQNSAHQQNSAPLQSSAPIHQISVDSISEEGQVTDPNLTPAQIPVPTPVPFPTPRSQDRFSFSPLHDSAHHTPIRLDNAHTSSYAFVPRGK
ncbi:unnamed protein product, partial [Meganyctiphanes norvegica]